MTERAFMLAMIFATSAWAAFATARWRLWKRRHRDFAVEAAALIADLTAMFDLVRIMGGMSPKRPEGENVVPFRKPDQ